MKSEKPAANSTFAQDWLLSEGSKNWKYQAKPWIGIGIGFSFFGQGDTEGKPGDN